MTVGTDDPRGRSAIGEQAVAPVEVDALVIGAGPVGLFLAFQLGLLEIGARIVDALPHPGGQCVELYGDKPIYDIPSVAVCTGRELAERLLAQLAPFQVPLHLGEVVVAVEQQDDGRRLVRTERATGGGHGRAFLARTVFIAAGVGAFRPRRLALAGLDAFEGTQLFYRAAELPATSGRHVVVVGGDEGAVAAAIELATREAEGRPASVTLLHRRAVLDAPPGLLERMQALCDANRLRFAVGQVTGVERDGGQRLHALGVTDPDASTGAVRTDLLLVQLGLSPKLGPVADWGLALERRQLVVDTERFETSAPGIFAVGDVNTYPGKKKLIVCGFHEATLAAWGAAPIVHPDRRLALQYTTTSPRLHELLGVAPERTD